MLLNFFLLVSFIFFDVSASIELPNIIIFLADDLGYADASFSRNQSLTPNIASIARNGYKFTNAYATAPQCSPSRAALLSGLYQQRFGHESNEEHLACLSNSSTKIIPEYLKIIGYKTAMFGKVLICFKLML